MPTANLALVRRCYELYDSGDLDGALECLHPDVEWDTTLLLDGTVVHGRENVGEFWRGLWESLPFWHEDKNYLPAGDRVLVLARIVGRGRGSGIEIGDPCAYLWEIEAGLGRRVKFFPGGEIERAREEAGLAGAV
jgi:ketosteroid isomerase-like protein